MPDPTQTPAAHRKPDSPAIPTPVRRRGRPRTGEEAVAPVEMLAAALHGFAVHGYQGVSLRMLCQEMGVSHNLVHQRFGSKERLWHAAVDWGFQGLSEALAEADPGGADVYARLHALIVAFIEFIAARPDLLRLVDVEGAVSSPRLDYLVDRYIGPGTTPIGVMVEELYETTGAPAPPAATMHFLITRGGASVFTAPELARRLDTHPPGDTRQVRAHARIVADILVAGMRQTLQGPPRQS